MASPVSGGGVKDDNNFQGDGSGSGEEMVKSSSRMNTERDLTSSQTTSGTQSTTPQPPPGSGGGVEDGKNFLEPGSDSGTEKDTFSSRMNTERNLNSSKPPPVLGGGGGGGRKGYKLTKLGWIPEEWEEVRLSDLIDGKRKIRYGIVQPGEYDPNGRFMVRGQDYSFSKGWNSPENLFHVSDKIEEKYKKARLKGGDLILTIVGAGTGHVQVIPAWLEGANITQTTARIAIDESKAHNIFYLQYLNSDLGKKQTYRFIKGGAQPGLNIGDVEKYHLANPPLPEQQKIAQILSTWDRAIQKTEQLIAKKQDRKKGLMQQLLTGKKRFWEFVKLDKMKETKLGLIPEDWQAKKVTEVFEFLPTNSFSRNQMHYDISENSIYNIHYGDIHATYKKAILDFEVEKCIPVLSKEILPSKSSTFLQSGDVIIADASEDYKGVGEAIELKNINEKRVLAGLHTIALRDNSYFTAEGFRAYIFKNPKVSTAIKVIATGSKVFGISKANLEKFELILPPVEEQKKIAFVLSAADQEILRLQNQLAKIKNQKKGLMQKLLTGEVRVV